MVDSVIFPLQLMMTSFIIFFLAGLGFVTSITFIFLIGVFMSSWLGASLLGLGEFFIKRMPLVRHIYSASKQISAAISPGTKPLRPKILACQVDLVLRESTLASRVVDALTARKLAICTGHRALFVPVEATGTSGPVLNAGYFSTGRNKRY